MSYFDADPPDPSEFIAIIVVGSVLTIAVMVSCLGCSTTKCPPCVPEVKTVTVKVPVDSCEPPMQLPALVLPDWPKLPDSPTEDEIKAFYADCVSTMNARKKIMLDRIDAIEEILDKYR